MKIKSFWSHVTLLFLFVFCSSFALVESSPSTPPPAEYKNKKQMRFKQQKEKQIKRLKTKMAKTKNKTKKAKLKKRIIQKENQLHSRNPVFGILGIVFGSIAFLMLFVFLIALIFTAAGLLAQPFIFLFAGLVLGILGLASSITGLILGDKKPDIFGPRGLSLAGLIISAIATGILAFALGLYFAFL